MASASWQLSTTWPCTIDWQVFRTASYVSRTPSVNARLRQAQGGIGVFLEKSLRGLPIEIWGDGSEVAITFTFTT